jgi:hypothetical protein
MLFSASAPSVEDSHDRYANVDTSYLLQRLEGFQAWQFWPPVTKETSIARSCGSTAEDGKLRVER